MIAPSCRVRAVVWQARWSRCGHRDLTSLSSPTPPVLGSGIALNPPRPPPPPPPVPAIPPPPLRVSVPPARLCHVVALYRVLRHRPSCLPCRAPALALRMVPFAPPHHAVAVPRGPPDAGRVPGHGPGLDRPDLLRVQHQVCPAACRALPAVIPPPPSARQCFGRCSPGGI